MALLIVVCSDNFLADNEMTCAFKGGATTHVCVCVCVCVCVIDVYGSDCLCVSVSEERQPVM